MAKDRKKLQHIHSSIPDKQPTPLTLEVGEIAVNNAKDQEFLSIKNSDDKVVRFSSDAQMIEWMERKEVMPYEGQVRGAVGPTGTKDSMGSYGITNDDLLHNKSNLIIKNNQVAAENTVKHNIVNGAKDIYNKEVNPTSDSGVTDGAGFAIDMSRYAMIGANPSFSSITVTDKSDLSGNTTIANGNGTGTRTGHTLAIKTTDVTANDTNWTETITNRVSTVTNETDKITTLKESATTRTTVVGTENLTVSGTTTEVHTGNVTVTNSANVTATTNGTTTETKVGNVTENNQSNKTENTTGAHSIYSTGNTCINSQANANFYGKVNTNVGVACDGTTKGSATTVVGTTTLNMSGVTTTISGNTTNVTGATTLNLSGNTTNKRALTANTTSTSAYTSATTATTVIGTANTSATTATLSGNTLDITEATRLSAKTPSATISGTNFTLNEINTTINSCGKVEITTDKYTLKQCSTSGGTAEFEFCNGYTVKSNAINLQQCGTAGTINVTSQTQNINGGNLTVRESGATDFSGNTLTTTSAGNTNINVKGNFTEVVTGTTNETHTGAVTINNGAAKTETTTGAVTENNKAGYTVNTTGDTTIESNGTTNIHSIGDGKAVHINAIGGNNIVEISTTGNKGKIQVNAVGDESAIQMNSDYVLCLSGKTTAAFVGGVKTNIGLNCSDGGNTTTLNVRGVTTNISAGTITQTTSGNTTINVGGALTENVTGATTENHGGAVTINNTNGVTITTTGKTCMQSTTDVNIGGDANTNVGAACNGGVYSNNTSINASSTVNVNAPTTNITGNTNISGNTVIKGITNISGATHIDNNLTIPITCNGITSTTVNNALCEVLDRGVVTIEKNTNPTDPQLATIYTVKQNGAVINTIEVAKDQFLQNAEVVKNTSGEWVIRLTWWIYDPDSGTHTTTTTDINASDLVKDLTAVNPGDNGTAANHNVKVSSWYDSTSGDMKFSAETTPTMHVTNMYATNAVSGATVSGTSTSAGTLTVTGNETVGGTLNVSGASTVNGVLTIPSGVSKKLTWASGTFTADTTGYNGSADKVITVPTSTAHLTKSTLTIDYNTDVRSKADTSYNTEAAATVSIPGSIDHLSNYDGTNINIGHPTNINGNVNVTGTVTASGAIYSSDRNLKENIQFVKRDEFNKVANIFAKSYNFKSDENKSKMYGVIAQDVQEAGFPELVHITDDNGTLGVDYTSLFVLKIAYLEDFCSMLLGKVANLENKIKELENK
jgi:hypothetical protein